MLRRVIGEDVEFELRLDAHRLPVEVHPVADRPGADEPRRQRPRRDARRRQDVSTDSSTWKLDETRGRAPSPTPASAWTRRRRSGSSSPSSRRRSPARVRPRPRDRVRHRAPRRRLDHGLVGAGPGNDVQHQPAARRARGRRASSTRSIESTAPDGGPETVLVVEDEAGTARARELMLEEAGYDVLTAANAAEALARRRRPRIDLLVVDVVMPGLSGPQLVAELAARGSDVPAVFISGYGADEVSSRGLAGQRGADREAVPGGGVAAPRARGARRLPRRGRSGHAARRRGRLRLRALSDHLGVCRVLVPRAGSSTRVRLAVWQERRPMTPFVTCRPPSSSSTTIRASG